MKFWKNGFDFQKIKLEGSQQCQSNPSIPLNPCELLKTPPTSPHAPDSYSINSISENGDPSQKQRQAVIHTELPFKIFTRLLSGQLLVKREIKRKLKSQLNSNPIELLLGNTASNFMFEKHLSNKLKLVVL